LQAWKVCRQKCYPIQPRLTVSLQVVTDISVFFLSCAATALATIPDEIRTEAVQEWAGAVAEMVQSEVELDAWCVERSIVSIRVTKDDGWLNMSELRDLYRWMSMDVSDLVPEASAEEKQHLSKSTYIGQPVDVAESHAIVRIALGVESLLSFLDDKIGTLEEDKATVQKLVAIAKHFKTLKKSGI
jgi:hypothetical protein